MKNLFPSLAKAAAVAMCALTFGSCNRAEYAMLPQGASYHGVTRAATPVPPKAETAAVQTPAATVEATTPAPATPVAAAPTTRAAAATTKAPKATAEPVAPKTLTSEEAATVASAVATVPQAQAPQKMTRVQKFAASRLIRTMNKVSGVTQFQKTLNVAKAQKVSGNLRTGIILILLGILISLFNRISSIFGLIGAIIAIIGVFFIILWLLDNL